MRQDSRDRAQPPARRDEAIRLRHGDTITYRSPLFSGTVIAKMSMKDDVCHYQILYNILYFEEVLEAKVTDKILSDSLFAAINDSIFQKTMSLYKKQREEIGAVRHREKVISSNLENLEVVQTYDTEKDASNDDKPGGLSSCCDGKESESAVPNYNEDVDMSSVLQEVEACLATACQKLDEPGVTDILVLSEIEVSMLNMMEMVVDPVPKQEVMNTIVENKSSSLKDVEQSDAILPSNFEEMKHSDSPGGGHSSSNEGKKLIENKCRFSPIFFCY